MKMTITPKAGATSVDRNAAITLSFGEKVYQSNYDTLTSANINSYMKEIATLKSSKSSATTAFTATINSTGRVITITPDAPLAA